MSRRLPVDRLIDLTKRSLGRFVERDKSWHIKFLSQLASELLPETYLEIGVYKASTFNSVAPYCSKALAVDINPDCERYLVKPRNHENREVHFFHGSAQDALDRVRQVTEHLDVVFIDGDHRLEAVLADVETVMPLLHPRSFLLLHDTWPATKALSADRFCSNSYLVPRELRSRYPEWTSATIPLGPGLTVLHHASLLPAWA